jgi:hypothetical protein
MREDRTVTVRDFRPTEWAEIRRFLGDMASAHPEFGYLVAVVDSVIDGDRTSALAATTSMHDLIVTPTPLTDSPWDVIVVRAPGSLHPPVPGNVRIEHLTSAGRDERIERPASEAIPLFWRFVIEKFGLIPPER